MCFPQYTIATCLPLAYFGQWCGLVLFLESMKAQGLEEMLLKFVDLRKLGGKANVMDKSWPPEILGGEWLKIFKVLKNYQERQKFVPAH